jgi:hypothetical protein
VRKEPPNEGVHPVAQGQGGGRCPSRYGARRVRYPIRSLGKAKEGLWTTEGT